MACFAACTTLSGVSFGQLMMTDFCGATAMAKVARSATKEAVSAKRMLLDVVQVLRCADLKWWIAAGVSFEPWDVKCFRLANADSV
jgi:hypothetical protein